MARMECFSHSSPRTLVGRIEFISIAWMKSNQGAGWLCGVVNSHLGR